MVVFQEDCLKHLKKFILIGMLLPGVLAAGGADKGMKEIIERVRAEAGPLTFGRGAVYSPSIEKYFRFYGLDIDGVDHNFGYVESGGYRIMVHVFRPEQVKGTILAVHGYYDHAGVLKHVIREMAGRGYAVFVYDQPGHGLSSGARVSINDFSEYVKVFRGMSDLCRKELPGPYHIIAHSMGCSGVIDYFLNGGPDDFGNVVFIAPLIRSAAWKTSGVGSWLVGSVFDSVPRNFRQNSSDPDFLAFVKADPLQDRVVPMSWVKSHRRWFKSMKRLDVVCGRPVKVIQGTKDTTVDWKYNMKFLRKRFSAVDISLLDGGGHQLINESGPILEQTLDLAGEWISPNDPK